MAEATAEPGTDARWARDLLETELVRAGEEGLTKDQLQGGLSLGTDDLRVGLEALREEGALKERGGRFVLDEVAVGQRPDDDLEGVAATEARALEELEGDEDADALGARPDPAEEEAPGLGGAEARVAAVEGFYKTRIVLDVSFKPDAPGGDEVAVRDANDIKAFAERGVLSRFPDLAVSSGVISVDAFDNPRHVWP